MVDPQIPAKIASKVVKNATAAIVNLVNKTVIENTDSLLDELPSVSDNSLLDNQWSLGLFILKIIIFLHVLPFIYWLLTILFPSKFSFGKWASGYSSLDENLSPAKKREMRIKSMLNLRKMKSLVA